MKLGDRILLLGGVIGLTAITVIGMCWVGYLSVKESDIPPSLTAIAGASTGALVTIAYALMSRTHGNGDKYIDHRPPLE